MSRETIPEIILVNLILKVQISTAFSKQFSTHQTHSNCKAIVKGGEQSLIHIVSENLDKVRVFKEAVLIFVQKSKNI